MGTFCTYVCRHYKIIVSVPRTFYKRYLHCAQIGNNSLSRLWTNCWMSSPNLRNFKGKFEELQIGASRLHPVQVSRIIPSIRGGESKPCAVEGMRN